MLPYVLLGFRLSEPDEGDLQENNLSMMKGSDLELACHTKPGDELSNHATYLQKWTKLDDENFANQLHTLKLYDLQKQDAGNYMCSHFGYRRQLSLKILCKFINFLYVCLFVCLFDLMLYVDGKQQ